MCKCMLWGLRQVEAPAPADLRGMGELGCRPLNWRLLYKVHLPPARPECSIGRSSLGVWNIKFNFERLQAGHFHPTPCKLSSVVDDGFSQPVIDTESLTMDDGWSVASDGLLWPDFTMIIKGKSKPTTNHPWKSRLAEFKWDQVWQATKPTVSTMINLTKKNLKNTKTIHSNRKLFCLQYLAISPHG